MILESPLTTTAIGVTSGSSTADKEDTHSNSLTSTGSCESQHNTDPQENQEKQENGESTSPDVCPPAESPADSKDNSSPEPRPDSGSNPEQSTISTAPNNANRWLSKCSDLPAKLSNKIVTLVESYFYRLGYTTGKYPFVFVAIGLLLTCITAGVYLKEKSNTEREWIPKSLMNLNDQINWVKKWEHMQESRTEEYPIDETIIIVRDKNILTEQSIKQLMDLHTKVWNLEAKNMNLQSYWNWGLVKMRSLLEIWNFNQTIIYNLTTEDILRDINRYEEKYKNLIGTVIAEVVKNGAGFITAAKVTRLKWQFAYTSDAWLWEKNFSDTFHVNPTKFDELYFYTYYDYTGYGSGMDQDINYAISGYAIMSVYVLISLGHCNCLEQKIGLTIAGMMCIAMGYGFTVGMGALLGVKTGKLNDILALMLLGIGIDDMFVILGTLRNLSADVRSRSIPEQMGHVMKQAGVSITITTLSDVVAFGIGALSVFPGLNTFCVYNAIGILAIYFYQITFFASCISLDLRRILDQRNACFCCYKHDDYKPNSCSQSDIMQFLFEKIASRILTKRIFKGFVLFITVCFGSVNIWCTLQLKADDDWQRVMYPTTHVYYKFHMANEKYFPTLEVDVYCRDMNIQKNEVKLYNMSENLLRSPYIYNSTVQNWFTAFVNSSEFKNANDTHDIYNGETLFNFLTSGTGVLYRSHVEIDIVKLCSVSVHYSSFCSRIPDCDERPKYQKFPNPTVLQNCSVNNLSYDVYHTSCNCKVYYSMLCRCTPPFCAPSNMTSFNVTCFKETSTICNYQRLNKQTTLASNMDCYKNVIQVWNFKISIKQIKYDDLSNKLKTMEDLQSRISPYFSDEKCFAHASKYLRWSINNIIERELIRNISLAFVSVLVITLILITNLWTSLMVGSSVILTMINITGSLYLWGINIETTSCVILTISVGLVVDYSVHIGHTFMTVAGEKNHRMIVTVKEIGPPVFHGGFSTFIAVLPLSVSITYPFQTFFKIFFLVVLFGLFHGLIYLPVLLSVVGPAPYATATERDVTILKVEKKPPTENTKQGITNQAMVLEGEVDGNKSLSDIERKIPQHEKSVENENIYINSISAKVALQEDTSHYKKTHLQLNL